MKILLEIAVPGPFAGGLDYEFPEISLEKNRLSVEALSSMLCGARVQTPLGKKQVTGVVLKVKTSINSENNAEKIGSSALFSKTTPSQNKANQTDLEKPKKTFTLKPITQILDTQPLYQGALFKLILWMSRYYHHPIGDTFQTALIGALSDPESLDLPPLETYRLTETGQFIYNIHLAPLTQESGNTNTAQAALEKSLNQSLVQTGSLKRSPHQQKLLILLNQAVNKSLSKEDLKNLKNLEIPASAINNALKSLLEKNWIQKTLSPPILKESVPTDFAKTLTPEQQEALDKSLAASTFQVQCLEGITGSGKTEIYLQRIQPLLDQGKQVLILVPEIGLTPQTLKRFENRFKYPVIALHSGLNAFDKKAAIYHAMHGHAKIIIGTRSAIFIPTKNLGLIIVDEEHDLSFKQQNGLRYHARDVAIKRAQLENIPILLGSATLSLETLHHALSQKYLHLKLLHRPGEATLPILHRINLKAQKNLIDGISQPLIQAIKKHLDQQGQVLIFINRRGFAPMLMCHDCGWQAICPRCDKPYTLHIHPTRLSCHHCEVQKNILNHCPECDSDAPLSDVGVGTEKLELALQTLFPTKQVLRIDRSNTSKKNSMEKHLEQIQSGQADILVGTQMLAKGHHFENLTMVGVIKIDDALFSNDFRSSEHLGQLLTQVSGRAGREKIQGEVYIQTHHIDHPLLNLLLTEGYGSYAKALLEERKNTHFPPYSYLALIRAEGHSMDQNHEALRHIKTYCQAVTRNIAAKACASKNPQNPCSPLEKNETTSPSPVLDGNGTTNLSPGPNGNGTTNLCPGLNGNGTTNLSPGLDGNGTTNLCPGLDGNGTTNLSSSPLEGEGRVGGDLETESLSFLGPFPAFLAKKGGIYRSQLLLQSQDRKILHQVLNQLQFFLQKNPIKKIRLFFDIDPIELD